MASPGYAAGISPEELGAMVDGRIPDAFRQVVPRVRALLDGVPGNTAGSGLYPKIVAVSGTAVFAWDSISRTIRMVRLDRNAAETVQVLKPKHKVPETVKQLAVSANGSHLALVADDGVAVVKIPEPRGTVGVGGGAADAAPKPCHSAMVGNAHNTRVRQAQWHPLAPECLVILNGDGWLRLYDIGGDTGAGALHGPCLSFPCTPPARKQDAERSLGYKPVAFDFGPPSDWCALTIFILLENGELHYLCPVVPPRTEVPKRVLDEMRMASRDAAALEWVDDMQRTGELHHLLSATLDETFAPPVVISAEDPAVLQGPFSVLPDESRRYLGSFGMLGLAVLPHAAPAVLVAIDSRGELSVVALVDSVQPSWARGKHGGDGADGGAVWMVEKIRLDFGPVNVPEPTEAAYAALVLDRTYPGRLFVYHPHGLDEVNITYLEAFLAHVQSARPEDHPLPAKLTSVALRLTTYLGPADDSPPTVTHAAFELIDHPEAGHHVLTHLSDGETIVEWMDLPRTRQPPHATRLPAVVAEPTWEPPKLLASGPKTVTIQGEPSPEDMVEVSECFWIVKEYINQMTDKIKPIAEKTQELEARRAQQVEAVERSRTLAEMLVEDLDHCADDLAELEKRALALVDDFHNDLRLYDLCLDQMHSVIPDTSEAEVKYQRSIKDLEMETRRLTTSAAMVAEKCRRGVADGLYRVNPGFPMEGAAQVSPRDSLAKIKEAAARRPAASAHRKELDAMHRTLSELTDDVLRLADTVSTEEHKIYAMTSKTT